MASYIKMLFDFSKSVFANADIDQLLPVIQDLVLQETGAERCQIALFSSNGQTILDRVRVRDNVKDDPANRKISSKVISAVVESNEVVVSPNAMIDRRFHDGTAKKDIINTVIAQQLLSIACAPLIYKEQTFGVIYIDNRTEEGIFNKDTGTLLKGLADLMSDALVKSLERTLKRRKEAETLQAQIRELREEVDRLKGYDKIVGNSPAMKKVYEQIERSREHDFNVLITGETGTGKERFARACHNLSPRSGKPLVTVNCAALPANLIESELFGHIKGAFTGAISNKTGRFELADGGAVFLDEIGDLPLESQAKLLRVLQEGEIQRIGESKIIKVDVRFISATNRDLRKAVADGEFREDLYYRLTEGITLTLPPLRERGDDVILIANHILEELNNDYQKNVSGMTDEACALLLKYDYPGNVRDLRRIIKNAYIYTDTDQIDVHDLQPAMEADYIADELEAHDGYDYISDAVARQIYQAHLPEEYQSEAFIEAYVADMDEFDSPGQVDPIRQFHDRVTLSIRDAADIPLKVALKAVSMAFERNYIIQKLMDASGKIVTAHKEAGIDKKTMIEKIKSHGLKREWYVD